LTLTHHSPCIVAVWEAASICEGLIGVFNVMQEANCEQFIQIPNLPKGIYENLFVDMGVSALLEREFRTVSVDKNGLLPVPAVASVLYYVGVLLHPKPFYSEIFDFNYRQAYLTEILTTPTYHYRRQIILYLKQKLKK
ncbi:unnamed protein product, partial [Didymodactylos carnosus]